MLLLVMPVSLPLTVASPEVAPSPPLFFFSFLPWPLPWPLPSWQRFWPIIGATKVDRSTAYRDVGSHAVMQASMQCHAKHTGVGLCAVHPCIPSRISLQMVNLTGQHHHGMFQIDMFRGAQPWAGRRGNQRCCSRTWQGR